MSLYNYTCTVHVLYMESVKSLSSYIILCYTNHLLLSFDCGYIASDVTTIFLLPSAAHYIIHVALINSSIHIIIALFNSNILLNFVFNSLMFK